MEKIYLLSSTFSFFHFSAHTSHTSHLFPCHPGAPPFLNLRLFFFFFHLFISSVPASLFCAPTSPAPPIPPSLPPHSASAANSASHLLCQEVWSQREPGDSEPAGRLPVWTVPPGNVGSKLVLGERVRRARWRGQSVGHTAHVLPLLLATGLGQGFRLAARKPKGSQLQVSFCKQTHALKHTDFHLCKYFSYICSALYL